MSALTLIAFLFFLNILQNCLEDQMKHSSKTTIMMVSASNLQGREPTSEEQNEVQQKQYEEEQVLKTRKLLSIDDEEEQSRESRFITDFGVHARDWTNELTQITDEDLVGQKQKVDQLREMWNKKRRTEIPEKVHQKPNLEDEVMRVKVKKFVNSPILSDIKSIPKLSQYWDLQKTSTFSPEPKYVEFEIPKKKVADFHEFESLSKQSEIPELLEVDNSIIQNAATSLRLQSNPDDLDSYQSSFSLRPRSPVGVVQPVTNPSRVIEDVTRKPQTTTEGAAFYQIGLVTPEPTKPTKSLPTEDDYDDGLNTPRYRRSDEILTTVSSSELFLPENNEITESLPAETTKTYQVYTHPAQIFSNMWRTSTQLPKAEKFDVNNIYLTTAKPMTKYSGHRYSSHPSNHRSQYKPPTRYQYSPYRRVPYEPPVVRQEYYPMSVVGQYNGSEGDANVGIGILKLVWNLVQSFASPLARLVPHVSKVSSVGEARCFDLLACEAYRMGTFMGPSAQALAVSFNSVLSWVMPAGERSALDSALAAARHNSCQKQIEACDEKSGGKSAMTAIAKLMELKTNRQARLP